MADLPKIFVGSSSEGILIAQALQHSLRGIADCVLWNQGLFQLGKSNLENLYSFIDQFDFAVIVVSPDDSAIIRDNERTVARDNVIFELGLFVGGLGRERVIFVGPNDDDDFHLPTDLDGIAMTFYDSRGLDENPLAAVGSASFQIRQHIRRDFALTAAGERRKKPNFVGAVCFRKTNSNIEYLLVKTSARRRLFPKGRVGLRKTATQSVEKYAHVEGGVRGRIVDNPTYTIKYYKEETHQVHLVEFFLIEVTISSQPRDAGREPEWHSYESALTSITSQRDYNTSYELVDLMEWSKKHIDKYYKRTK